MTSTIELTALQQRIQELEKELAEAKQRNVELEQTRNASGSDELAVPISEYEETLRRLVQRTAMIVQSEKCVIMVHDRESNQLVGRSPAWGLPEADVLGLRVGLDSGYCKTVFDLGFPSVFQSVEETPGLSEQLMRLNIRNGVSVPLLIEKRDDQNRIIDRITVGVLHCFNKRYGAEFNEEDVRLLERLSRNAAAVIANAQMFRELFEEKQKLVHTLESLTTGLILINQHNRIGQMNAQARTLFGLKSDSNPIGQLWDTVVKHDKSQEIFKKRLTEISKDDESGRKPDEFSIYDEDETEYIYQVHAATVHDDRAQQIGTVFILNDITDLRNVERMKTEFVSIVSHELRTPLTPMKGFVRTLLDDEEETVYDRELRREFYTIIDENVDRLGRLINDLLNVSRIERLGIAGLELNWQSNVDLREVTEHVVSTQRGRAPKHTLVVEFDPEKIYVETDRDMIQNVLHNIINNAIKYSPDGGDVRITALQEPPSEAFPFGSLLMQVKDQGLGIKKEDLKGIGEKFNRSTNKQAKSVGGTGIGLFLVKNILAAHQGTMWPESEGLGKGATFSFRIPMQQPKQEETSEQASE